MKSSTMRRGKKIGKKDGKQKHALRTSLLMIHSVVVSQAFIIQIDSAIALYFDNHLSWQQSYLLAFSL